MIYPLRDTMKTTYPVPAPRIRVPLVQLPDWAEHAGFLATLAANKAFMAMPEEVSRIILRLAGGEVE